MDCKLDWGTTNHMLLLLRDAIECDRGVAKFLTKEKPNIIAESLLENAIKIENVRKYILKQQEECDKEMELTQD